MEERTQHIESVTYAARKTSLQTHNASLFYNNKNFLCSLITKLTDRECQPNPNLAPCAFDIVKKHDSIKLRLGKIC